MEMVVRNRQFGRAKYNLPDPLPEVDGFIARMDCSEIGHVVEIEHAGKIEHLLVTDCVGDIETHDWMLNNNILGEVDYRTAQRWDVVGRGAHILVCHHVYRQFWRE